MEMNKAIVESLNCYKICTQTKVHCLEMGDEHADPDHINMLSDCAKICLTTADFMIRESEFHPDLCMICADVCESCAEDCDAFEDQFMKDCAAQCRKCAQECRHMGQ